MSRFQMLMHRLLKGLGAAALLALAVACSDSPTAPDNGTPGPGPGTGSGSCRTYASSYTLVTTTGTHVTTTKTTTIYNRTTNTATSSSEYSDNFGLTYTLGTVATYPSLAAFIAEVSVVPPLERSTRLVSTFTGMAPNVVTRVNTYDGQNRLQQYVSTSLSPATTVTHVVLSWDASGRPVRVEAAGVVTENSYDDTARTHTARSAGAESSQTYDANGNPVHATFRTAGGQTGDSVYTIHTTEQVCP